MAFSEFSIGLEWTVSVTKQDVSVNLWSYPISQICGDVFVYTKGAESNNDEDSCRRELSDSIHRSDLARREPSKPPFDGAEEIFPPILYKEDWRGLEMVGLRREGD